ncbi:hypothetical protein ON010_g16404 [Phytophthora cinnamomi]|nr:hypothetical protein ON010_g16404 [Phytophthora cinnamomi]
MFGDEDSGDSSDDQIPRSACRTPPARCRPPPPKPSAVLLASGLTRLPTCSRRHQTTAAAEGPSAPRRSSVDGDQGCNWRGDAGDSLARVVCFGLAVPSAGAGRSPAEEGARLLQAKGDAHDPQGAEGGAGEGVRGAAGQTREDQAPGARAAGRGSQVVPRPSSGERRATIVLLQQADLESDNVKQKPVKGETPSPKRVKKALVDDAGWKPSAGRTITPKATIILANLRPSGSALILYHTEYIYRSSEKMLSRILSVIA